METYNPAPLNWNFRALQPFKIIIIGAGIAGLTTAIGLQKAGHDVLVLEQAKEIVEVGAGIQIAPNAARILGRFGLLEKVMEKANVLKGNSVRRWEEGEELGMARLMPEIGEKYHAPLSVIHRADLQQILLSACYSAGINIRLSSRVVSVDPSFSAQVQLSNGEWLSSDLVICADGIKSAIRSQIANAHGLPDHTIPTGDAAYRILIPKEKMEQDEQAAKLLADDKGIRWMGPGGHIMAYPIKQNTLYNMVLIHPSKHHQTSEKTKEKENWTDKGSKLEMMDMYANWNPLVKDLMSYVPEGEVMEWTLNSHLPLPSWVENRCVLIGDACHPMLPYVAQGAAQAIEDAGVLACALSKTRNLDVALGIYQAMRKGRAEKIQNSAAVTRIQLHLEDGEEQRERDRRIKMSGQRGGEKNPDLWADREWQDFMWGVDVMKDCIDHWEEWVTRIEGGDLDYAMEVEEDPIRYMENRRRTRHHLFYLYTFLFFFLLGFFLLLTWATVKDR